MPISEAQLAANRANAAKSTDPRTPEGKARSARNARVHGFTASAFAVVRLEDLDEVAHLKADLTAVYQPVNSQELFALDRMALTQQAMLRAARLESGLLTTCLDAALDGEGRPFIPMGPDLVGDGDLSLDIEITRAQNRNYALADGFHRMVRQANSWSLFLRYQAQAERHYRRAVEEFDRLKSLRAELPNEAILEVQPEEKEPTSASPDEPISTQPPAASDFQPSPEPPVNSVAPERGAAGGPRPESCLRNKCTFPAPQDPLCPRAHKMEQNPALVLDRRFRGLSLPRDFQIWQGLYLHISMSRPWFLVSLFFLGLPSFAATFGTVSPDLGVADLILDEPRGKLYLINSNLNRVDVWCLGPPACPAPGRRFLAPISTGTDPLAGAISPDGKFLYVTSYNQVSLNVIDLTKSALFQRVALPANPEGVAVGADGRVLITTIGAGANNSQNTLLVFDPSATSSASLTAVPIAVTAPAPPVTPPLGRTALSTRSALLATKDGSHIIGVNNPNTTTRIVFVYEVSSATVLRARTVSNVSNVLSISSDGSKFMAGLTLFETSTLTVLAQQNAANAPFSFPGGNANNFNTQQNQGGSVFSPDGTVLYSAFNIAPVQNPPAKANASRLLLNDPDNLLISLGLQLPENLAGKMVVTQNGGTVYALSESGFLTLPVGNIYQNPIAMPNSSVALLSNDQCGVSPNKQVSVAVNNMGTGRMTASAQLLSLPAPTTGGLGGFGGPGGGGPGGGIVIILAPAIPGVGAPGGVTAANGFGAANTSVLQTSPLLATQLTGSGANFTFRYNPVNAKTQGTVTPHDFLIQSPEAINIPPNVQIFQNNHDSDARGKVMPLAVNAASNEGLFDMVTDNARQRLYIANSGMNRVEVFDIRTQQFLSPIKVGQLPHSLAIGTDGITLYVANSGGETISVVDLDKGTQTGLIRFTPLPFNSNAALVTPNLIAAGLQGPQVVMSNGSLWRVVGNQVLPRKLNTAVFGTTTTLPGPSQTMAATPGGEYIFLLAGNGNGYLYDASVDDWVAERQLFTANANTSSLPAMTGYYGPIAAGPGGQYFLANGIIFNQSLTETGSVPTPASVGAVTGTPTRGAATPTAAPVAAVAAAGPRTFIRFSQPNATTTTGTAGTAISFPGTGGPGGVTPAQALTFTVPTIEVVDVTSGNTMLTGPALEGPLAKVQGNQTQRISGRTLAMDPSGNTAYALTTSGLSVIPLTPILPSDRPAVNQNGVVSQANLLTSLSPGTLASINGKNLASGGASSPGSPLPTVLGGSCVTLNNVPLPLIATSDGQVNVQIPVELAAGTYPLVVRSIDRQAASATTSLKLAKVAPAVFVDSNGQASIYDSNGKLVTKDNPTTRDRKLSIFATGLGVTKGGKVTSGNPAPSSPLAVTDTVAVYFGNPSFKQSQVIVNWSGLVPGMIGVNRIDVTVPGFHTEGDALPVTIKIDGVSSSNSGPTAPVTYSH